MKKMSARLTNRSDAQKVPDDVFANIANRLQEKNRQIQCQAKGLFNSDQPKPDKVDINYSDMNNFVVGKMEGTGEFNWVTVETDVKEILEKCFDLKSGKEIRNVIKHFANYGENETAYLMINSWIYKIDHVNIYIYLVGKKLDKTENRNDIKKVIEAQIGKSDYPNIKKG